MPPRSIQRIVGSPILDRLPIGLARAVLVCIRRAECQLRVQSREGAHVASPTVRLLISVLIGYTDKWPGRGVELTYVHRGLRMSMMNALTILSNGQNQAEKAQHTAESTSYTLNPEFMFVPGVNDGPICIIM